MTDYLSGEPARFTYWTSREIWSVLELSLLLEGIEPSTANKTMGSLMMIVRIGKSEKQFALDWEGYARDLAVSTRLKPALTPNNENEYLDYQYEVSDLLKWAEDLEIKIPTELQSLMTDDPEDVLQLENQLGDREKKNLLITIGVLAQLVVEKTRENTGDIEKPNISGIAALCHAKASGIWGMGKTSFRNRISDGLKLLQDSK